MRVRWMLLLVVAVPALAVSAEDPRTAIRAGVVARDAARWGEAVSWFRKAVDAAPTWSLARLELAGALLQTGGSTTEVGQHLEQARLLDADNPRLHYLTGLLHEEERRPLQAAAAYEQALVHRPSLIDARLRLGRLLVDEGKPAAAIEHLERVVEKEPESLVARAKLAEAHEATKNLRGAEAQLRAIAAQFPDNAYHLQRLVDFYERQGMRRQAEETRRRAEKLRPARDRRELRPLPKSRR